MYQAVIFDLDGTVADTLESIGAACNKTLEKCGFAPLETERYRYFAGDGADTLVKRALEASGDRELIHYEKAYKEYQEFFKRDCTYKTRVFPGMKETLLELRENGAKLGVATNKPHERAITVLDYLFGKDFFDRVLGAGSGFPKKPDPAGVLHIAESFGAKPSQCMYVGDTDVDMKTGQKAGMFTIGVLWGFRPRRELEENHAHVIIERPEELFALWKSLIKPGC